MKLKPALATLTLSFGLLLTACGNGDGSNSDNEKNSSGNNSKSAEELSGTVGIDGSSTVFPIMEAVSEEYAAEQPDVKAPVGVSGTGGGFNKFIAGETDISNASRPIKDEEAAKLKEAGIEYTEFKIAYDGLSVVVNKDNDFVDKLTVDELKKMWLESGKVKTWADVREGWPEEPISFFSPGTDSGTYDYWNEVILEEEQMRKDATLSEDDNVLVQGVMGDKGAIAFFGYAYYIENKDDLKIVPIVNSKGEAITPDNDTIMNGEYEPLSRPLFFYVNNKSIAEKEHVYDYVKFALENASSLSEDVGYISLQEKEYEDGLAKLEELKK
ncbi:PstS family phosphate ABC transporter substrate-binding protein [Siminovitchia sp. FSL H7-0308]|uniref:Phosphate-binding protein n=1 Tax=Siminovitchia thermophila TaxID=1245522 RepID=A0ABS2R5E8_9BACI|nr:PstS family phosphate ABC transporter substrate-binding protein [Siminovitchia thermophila]MBM7713851.1 phosphate transport system substrate-binding protein [Siminovitchia thermophila]ONK22513.1 phosphate-binding protein [Bacillus sp. VT-16-64]